MLLRPFAILAVVALACGGADHSAPAPFATPAAWTLEPAVTTVTLTGVWGRSMDDVFVVGAGTILRWDGRTWTRTSRTEALSAVWGDASSAAVFAGGRRSGLDGGGGVVLRFDGRAWTQQDIGTDEGIFGIWGRSATDVYAVADHGTILHFDGSTWTRQESGTANPLYAVWGSASGDVFAVDGFAGQILHWDGSRWAAQQVEGRTGTRGVTDVWGFAADDVYAASGTDLLHYDGVAWTRAETAGVAIHALGGGARRAYVVGASGAVARLDGAGWRDDPQVTRQDLWAVWGSDAGAFAVGDSGTILRHDASDVAAR